MPLISYKMINVSPCLGTREFILCVKAQLYRLKLIYI